ncbi:hypothetical protein P153DRAFT_409506 [Dothidotthia symphoricarpi CBS 119687]|uniref:Uncharacterized protein n=1 Tax=Dothidotthia symphoricarpi CBS 119687 TaxID=1392245 RepID=A0A6A6AQ26_9PLEO|nr:uncharacterized protein P153DRAFT_409506 [Dothidotthia symphoricarpi CBS 119687]KAF2134102.1 hypothetical protein P153DRAFT_409506 [Dothidotthia symphoricarpi CBS 119687]
MVLLEPCVHPSLFSSILIQLRKNGLFQFQPFYSLLSPISKPRYACPFFKISLRRCRYCELAKRVGLASVYGRYMRGKPKPQREGKFECFELTVGRAYPFLVGIANKPANTNISVPHMSRLFYSLVLSNSPKQHLQHATIVPTRPREPKYLTKASLTPPSHNPYSSLPFVRSSRSSSNQKTAPCRRTTRSRTAETTPATTATALELRTAPSISIQTNEIPLSRIQQQTCWRCGRGIETEGHKDIEDNEGSASIEGNGDNKDTKENDDDDDEKDDGGNNQSEKGS